MDQDDARVVYDDTRYFSRGRSGFRKDPTRNDELNARWAFCGFIVIVAVFGIVHALMPSIR
jgi:hypothetical protein